MLTSVHLYLFYKAEFVNKHDLHYRSSLRKVFRNQLTKIASLAESRKREKAALQSWNKDSVLRKISTAFMLSTVRPKT